MRGYYDAHKPPPVVICAHCGGSITEPRRDKIYCSINCGQLAHYYAVKAPREAEQRRTERAGRTCAHCTSPIPVERERNAVYCAAPCRRRAKYQRRKVEHKADRDRRRRGDQWRAINRTYAQRRRARAAASLYVEFTPEQLAARLSMFAGCWMCGDPAWTDVEHVKPLGKGGPHALCNLRPACSDCNLRKGATWHGVAPALALRVVIPSTPWGTSTRPGSRTLPAKRDILSSR